MAQLTGFAGTIHFDTRKPEGTMRKLLDVSRLSAMAWRARISLAEGLADTYDWYLAHQSDLRT